MHWRLHLLGSALLAITLVLLFGCGGGCPACTNNPSLVPANSLLFRDRNPQHLNDATLYAYNILESDPAVVNVTDSLPSLTNVLHLLKRRNFTYFIYVNPADDSWFIGKIDQLTPDFATRAVRLLDSTQTPQKYASADISISISGDEERILFMNFSPKEEKNHVRSTVRLLDPNAHRLVDIGMDHIVGHVNMIASPESKLFAYKLRPQLDEDTDPGNPPIDTAFVLDEFFVSHPIAVQHPNIQQMSFGRTNDSIYMIEGLKGAKVVYKYSITTQTVTHVVDTVANYNSFTVSPDFVHMALTRLHGNKPDPDVIDIYSTDGSQTLERSIRIPFQTAGDNISHVMGGWTSATPEDDPIDLF